MYIKGLEVECYASATPTTTDTRYDTPGQGAGLVEGHRGAGATPLPHVYDYKTTWAGPYHRRWARR